MTGEPARIARVSLPPGEDVGVPPGEQQPLAERAASRRVRSPAAACAGRRTAGDRVGLGRTGPLGPAAGSSGCREPLVDLLEARRAEVAAGRAGGPKNARCPPVGQHRHLVAPSASSGLCVVSTTVVPLSHERRAASASVPRRAPGPARTSARRGRTAPGPASSSAAMEARLRSPPDSWPTGTTDRPASSSVRSTS